MSIRGDLQRLLDACGVRYFSANELLVHTGKPLNHEPHPSQLDNILPAVLVLDALRSHLRRPIRPASVFRSPAYNASVGGATRSQHLDFVAIDFSTRRLRGAYDLLLSWRREMKMFRSEAPFFPLGKDAAGPERKPLPMWEERGGDSQLFHWLGGLAIYPSKNFIHIDARGSNRTWRGA